MTANPEKTELLASGREASTNAAGQFGLEHYAESAFRVVSTNGSSIIPSRPTLSLDSPPSLDPPSSPDISTMSESNTGSLDLSRAPAGIRLPEPDTSFRVLEPDDDTIADLQSNDLVGILADRAAPTADLRSAHFEARRAPISLQAHLKSRTNDRAAPTIGRPSIQPAPIQDEVSSSVEMRRTGFDSHLARTIDAWPSLPVHVRETIVTIIEAALNG